MERLVLEKAGRAEKVLEGICVDAARRLEANPSGVCPADMSLNFLKMCHAQSCGKCVPCRVGLGALATLIEKVLDGEGAMSDLSLIEETAAAIADTADCAIGYEAAEMVLKGIRGFRDDFESHVKYGRCADTTRKTVPCKAACPAHVDIPGYIALTKAGRYEDAMRLIRKDNPLPCVCAYVCVHPCEDVCRRKMIDDSVNICGIKRFAADYAGEQPLPECAPATGKKIAVVGGGPSGLTAAYYLRLMGHAVTIYERQEKLGGMVRYGIPDYRLPQEVLDKDIQYILDTGVEVKYGVNVGEDIDFDQIRKEYDAVMLTIGAQGDKKLGIEGEDADGVYSAVELLDGLGYQKFPDFTGKRVCVVGGGNVAMDAVRSSLRLGAESVSCVYRRRVEDMPANMEEIEDCQKEGAKVISLQAPDHIEVDENGKVAALWTVPQMVSGIDKAGRMGVKKSGKAPVRIPCDIVIVAIGQAILSEPFAKAGIKTNRSNLVTDKYAFVEGSGNVFAGGDAVHGGDVVVRAVAAGKVVADNIDEFLGFNHKISVDIDIPAAPLTNLPSCGRSNATLINKENLVGDFTIATEGMNDVECVQECSRCLRCDQFGYGSFKGGRRKEW